MAILAAVEAVGARRQKSDASSCAAEDRLTAYRGDKTSNPEFAVVDGAAAAAVENCVDGDDADATRLL